jgi:hypothetical protein
VNGHGQGSQEQDDPADPDRLFGGQTVSDASGKPINVDLESMASHVEV